MVSGVQRAGCAMVLKHRISDMLDFGHAGFRVGRISDRPHFRPVGVQACYVRQIAGPQSAKLAKRDVAGQDIE
jgi:hypothetical protein